MFDVQVFQKNVRTCEFEFSHVLLHACMVLWPFTVICMSVVSRTKILNGTHVKTNQ